MNNVALKSSGSSKNITMYIEPLGLSATASSLSNAIDGFLIVELMAIAFIYIPSSVILYIIRERENNAKHQ